MVGSRETAEELCQEAFLRVWRSAPGGELSSDRQVAWLHRTASNLAIDELRRRRLMDLEPLSEPADERSDAGEELAARETLGGLSAHERLVLLLRFEAGLTTPRSAARSCSPS